MKPKRRLRKRKAASEFEKASSKLKLKKDKNHGDDPGLLPED
eukprot:CAMPEP_0184031666 /NCGR_PEP_ID=MMETSP0955-20130417/2415_1 /TAXON_ID=627963 /ORGANISM="Aplanochytrium sp, Strain PBS07" /LENGTH=41 /DNA_ID= /DNA_START= /DNA_END= /DNA_ORIENTATION=